MADSAWYLIHLTIGVALLVVIVPCIGLTWQVTSIETRLIAITTITILLKANVRLVALRKRVN